MMGSGLVAQEKEWEHYESEMSGRQGRVRQRWSGSWGIGWEKVSRHAGDEDGRKGAWRRPSNVQCGGALRSAPAKPNFCCRLSIKQTTNAHCANAIKSPIDKAYGGYSIGSIFCEYD